MYILVLTFILVNLGHTSTATTHIQFTSEETCEAARASWARSQKTVNQMESLKNSKYVVVGICHKQ